MDTKRCSSRNPLLCAPVDCNGSKKSCSISNFRLQNKQISGRSRLVVGPCIACSLRSGVALALEILFFAPLSIVTKQISGIDQNST